MRAKLGFCVLCKVKERLSVVKSEVEVVYCPECGQMREVDIKKVREG